MAEGNNSDITLSVPIFYLLLSGTALGGAGAFGIAGKGITRELIEQCADQSETALTVAAQHGQEFIELRQQLNSRTRSRYTAENAESDWRRQSRVDDIQDRRMTILEAEVKKLSQGQ